MNLASPRTRWTSTTTPRMGSSYEVGRTSDGISRASRTWPRSATACSIRKSTSASPKSPCPKFRRFHPSAGCVGKWPARAALRDAEAKFEEIARRRAKVRDVRARALPRLEPLGYDRNKNAFWVFPRRDKQMEAVPRPRPASPLRIWVEDRSGAAPAWSFYEGTEVRGGWRPRSMSGVCASGR